MRVGFAGTPEFAASSLEALHQCTEINLVAVLTQPDRRAGRGMRLQPSAVKYLAQTLQLPVFTFSSLKEKEAQQTLISLNLDILVVVAYGLILPRSILSIPRHGCFNVHASLLPRWRGAAPIERALLAGDTETGVCIMKMDAGLDTGPVACQRSIPIAQNESAHCLQQRLAALGAELLLEALAQLKQGKLTLTEQSLAGICYAEKLSKTDFFLDWQRPAQDLALQVQVFCQGPGCFFWYGALRCKVWQAAVIPFEDVHQAKDTDQIGQVVGLLPGVVVRCAQGYLCLSVLQKAGAKSMDAAAFVCSTEMVVGDKLLQAAKIVPNEQ